MSVCVGVALDDDYTNICVNDDSRQRTVPTVVCREKRSAVWHVGEAAYKLTLAGEGIMVDKLLSLAKKKGTATIDGVCYTASELLELFFREILRDTPEADAVVVSLRRAEPGLMRVVEDILEKNGYGRDRARVVSHTECFAHFVLAQDKELYNHMVGMFELSNQCLYYYELRASRGGRKLMFAASQPQEEAFNLDILKTGSGSKIADRILTALAERLLDKKTFSAILLCGRGFESVDFAPDFMGVLCTRRRVCVEPRLFAIGAAYEAGVLAGTREKPEFTVICDTRVRAGIGVKVTVHEKETVLPLVASGESWFGCSAQMEAVLDGQDYVELVVTPVDQMRRMNVRVPLDGFPKRPPRTTKVQITVCFTAANRLRVTVRDRGFGSLFPASDASVTEEVEL